MRDIQQVFDPTRHSATSSFKDAVNRVSGRVDQGMDRTLPDTHPSPRTLETSHDPQVHYPRPRRRCVVLGATTSASAPPARRWRRRFGGTSAAPTSAAAASRASPACTSRFHRNFAFRRVVRIFPHYHWHWRWHFVRHPYWVAPIVGTSVVRPVYASNPTPTCNCLTKSYTQEGAVVFKDLCTKEMAMNPAVSPTPRQQGYLQPAAVSTDVAGHDLSRAATRVHLAGSCTAQLGVASASAGALCFRQSD